MGTDPKEQLLFESPKAVAHLRAQFQRKRLGLIFGSGASKDLGFPDWDRLVEQIARHKAVGASSKIKHFRTGGGQTKTIVRSLASVTQILFSYFREKRIRKMKRLEPLTFIEERQIKTDWLRIIHGELYGATTWDSRKKKLEEHPYLYSFLDIIKHSPLTVNYNFDDTLEKMLLSARTDEELSTTRGYEVTDRPNIQFQRESSVIYHPNGYLPSIFEDGASAQVIFSDDAFQDQLISAATGRYLHLSNHLFRNTCLLIGLSLEDVTLQSLLRQNAVGSPGNVHYIVQYTPNESKRDLSAERAVFRSNFESFNLYTLFLDNAGIKSLADLTTMSENTFKLSYEKHEPKFVYYVIGSVGAGKSTVASHFRNLITYDEWIDERKPNLAKPETDVPEDEVHDLNEWVAEQFRKKNFAVSEKCEGIHLIDRAPLDPLTFGEESDRPKKARNLHERITDKGKRAIERGHIIRLDCELEDIRVRNSLKHKYWPDAEYQRLDKAIKEIYGPASSSVVCTRGRGPEAVAHEIAKVIFLSDYKPVEIDKMLKSIGKSNVDGSA